MRAFLHLSLAVAALLSAYVPAQAEPDTGARPDDIFVRFSTGLGKITCRAHKSSQVVACRGIEYAELPRWQAPRTIHSWSNDTDATRWGASCYNAMTQDGGGALVTGEQSDRCGFLNVWAPAALFTVQGQPLHAQLAGLPNGTLVDVELAGSAPVHVYVHGGGFLVGSSSQDLAAPYPDRHVAAVQAVYVSMNYRLGAAGFAVHAAMLQRDPAVPAGGFGLADQVAAFYWVRAHAQDFGGEPGPFMVSGNSAGSFSLCFHLTNPALQGMMRAAVLQSGMCSFPFPSLEESLQQGRRLAEAAGCASPDDLEAELGCLEAVPMDQVRGLLPNRRGILWYEGELWWPVLGTPAAPTHPMLNLQAGQLHKDVHILAGVVGEEASLFFLLGFPLYLRESMLHDVLAATFNESVALQIKAWYDGAGAVDLHTSHFSAEGPADLLWQVAREGPEAWMDHPEASQLQHDDDAAEAKDSAAAAARLPVHSVHSYGARAMSDLWHCTFASEVATMAQSQHARGDSTRTWAYFLTHPASWTRASWFTAFLQSYHGSDLWYIYGKVERMSAHEASLSAAWMAMFQLLAHGHGLDDVAMYDVAYHHASSVLARHAEEPLLPAADMLGGLRWRPVDHQARRLPTSGRDTLADGVHVVDLGSAGLKHAVLRPASCAAMWDSLSQPHAVKFPPRMPEPWVSVLLNAKLGQWLRAVAKHSGLVAAGAAVLAVAGAVAVKRRCCGGQSKAKQA